MTVESPRIASILVVDDVPANLQLLAGILKDRGYKVRPVPSGKLALLAARCEPPDLILLDINMPEMNGYEVCERLKADPALAGIPVLFVSALDEYLDKAKAFAVGGVDYLTKPFQMEELHARVATHLKLRRLDPVVKSEQPKGDGTRPASILVVDDNPANLQLLAGILKGRRYKVRPVPSGELALLAAQRDPPDLILLDINMPEMNGYEVCERLKADPALAGIPVLFVSALTEHLDKVRAFAVGGEDYLTKPFQMEELHARVATHLKLRRMLTELEEFKHGSKPTPARWGKF